LELDLGDGDMQVLAQCSQKIGVSALVIGKKAVVDQIRHKVSLRNAGLKSVVKALSRALTSDTWLRLLGDQTDRQLKLQDK
jgi:hypothetical protein